jgi:hypothetical protein
MFPKSKGMLGLDAHIKKTVRQLADRRVKKDAQKRYPPLFREQRSIY